jgi:DNA modification methylase
MNLGGNKMDVLEQVISKRYAAYNGDSCELIKNIPDNSIHYTIFSPPFASLYTYSNSDRDMGNSKGDDEFYTHFTFLAKELYRVTMPGRLLSFHCMDLPLMKERDGVIGLKDFPALVRQIFEDCGFIYHSKVTIWKNPVTEMQRTKALGLLHKQIRKDSSMSRQGIPDYIVTMRKPGENPEKISHTHESFPVDVWQHYASPVWMDIKQSNTLQKKSARTEKDERHICPLQLDVIQRCIELWTNEGDIVLDPFAGIGSSPYVALTLNRRGIGFELKQSYFEQMKNNLEIASNETENMGGYPVGQMSIFDFLEESDLCVNLQ